MDSSIYFLETKDEMGSLYTIYRKIKTLRFRIAVYLRIEMIKGRPYVAVSRT